LRRGDGGQHADGFTVQVAEPVLDDLRQRLARTRWIHEAKGGGWKHGLDVSYLRGLVDYWRSGFDWRAQETAINRLDHFRTELGGAKGYFHPPRGPGAGPLALGAPARFSRSFRRVAQGPPLPPDPALSRGNAG